MTIYWRNKEDVLQSLDIIPSDESVREMEVMGTNALTLYFALPYYIEIPIGAYCEFEGRRYELNNPQRFAKNGNRKWDYTLLMSAPDGMLSLWKVRNPADGSLEFPYTATPSQHIDLIVTILNSHNKEGGAIWRVGQCLEAPEKLINYNHTQLSDALPELASLFETEYEIVTESEGGIDYNTINLCKIEYYKDSPIALSYGREGGFLPNLRRENSDNPAIERLFVQGTEKNVSSAHYKPLGGEVGSRRLLLPLAQELGYDGEYYSDETNYNSIKGEYFLSSDDGQSITRADNGDTIGNEDSLDCTDIVPAKEVVVLDVETEQATNSDVESYNEYNLILGIPQNEDYRSYQVDGEVAYIVFQSGVLAGREFDIHTSIDGALDIEQVNNTSGFVGWRFKLVAEEQDGYLMPSEVWAPAIGDKVKIFGIQLPDSVICDNATKSGASWDMFREAIRVMWERNSASTYYEGEISTSWVERNWQNVGAKIRCGGYVRFSDPAFESEGALIRITAVKTYINNSHAPQITLSNEVVRSGVRTAIEQIKGEEVTVDNVAKSAKNYTKRRFRDAKEAQAMLKQALSGEFTETLSPIAVNTMQAIVGSTTLQYTFVASLTDMSPQTYTPVIANETIELPSAYIKHETLGIEEVKPTRENTEYLRWQVVGDTLAFVDSNKAYYLYIKASDEGQDATFILSPDAIAVDAESGYYHFLLATIGKLIDGERSYQAWNGFTEVTPGAIRANRFVSTDGLQYVDFLNKEFRVGDSQSWIQYENGELEVSGALIGKSVLGQEIKVLDENGTPIAGMSGITNEPLIYGGGSPLFYEWEGQGGSVIYTIVDAPNIAVGDVVRVFLTPQISGEEYADAIRSGLLYEDENFQNTGVTIGGGRKYQLLPNGKHIIGTPNGKRVEISPNEDGANIVIYADDGSPRTTITGEEYDSISDLSPTTTTIKIGTTECGYVNYDGTTSENTRTFEFEALQSGTLQFPALDITHVFNTAGYQEGGDRTLRVQIWIYVDGVAMRFLEAHDDLNAYGYSTPQVRSTSPFSIPISTGKHSLKIRILRNYLNYESLPAIATPTTTITPVSDAEVVYSAYQAVLFSNGLSVVKSSNEQMTAINTASGMTIRAQVNNYGVEVDDNGVRIRIGGVWYTIGVASGQLTATIE